jgi:hypothetical protein
VVVQNPLYFRKIHDSGSETPIFGQGETVFDSPRPGIMGVWRRRGHVWSLRFLTRDCHNVQRPALVGTVVRSTCQTWLTRFAVTVRSD